MQRYGHSANVNTDRPASYTGQTSTGNDGPKNRDGDQARTAYAPPDHAQRELKNGQQLRASPSTIDLF